MKPHLCTLTDGARARFLSCPYKLSRNFCNGCYFNTSTNNKKTKLSDTGLASIFGRFLRISL